MIDRQGFDTLISEVVADHKNLSDLLLVPGKPVQAAVDNVLTDVDDSVLFGRPLAPDTTGAISEMLLGGDARLTRDLTERGYCDLSYESVGGNRFRVNVYRGKTGSSVAMRRLPSRVWTIDELGLPRIFNEMAREHYGLILVTGGTGTGKTTSLAALVDAINSTQPVHIITLEDPIEYLHPHKLATISQRELGAHFGSFAEGLRAALRQTPRVILVGEIRDRETIEVAMQAAETGHLVLGTLHTADAGGTISRIVGQFEPNEEHALRMRLAENIKFIASQRLLPKVGGGRVAAFEILRTSLRIRELILKGENGDKTFQNALSDGAVYGMVTFNNHIAKLYSEGIVDEKTAVLTASDRYMVQRAIDRQKTSKGQLVTSINNLELDNGYEAGI